ncbi:hypothetical protein CCAX7_56160 [Capsulimonas corticalis]|uniref:Uncharacterized protein n=2 Tax=Capsulimonas corticalis TaxID=2219043 RepID=A0A402D0L8_9BACT|nr:hypothetical protein CCAX7_56160 [Capsulimonas corticalis]
MLRLTSPLFAQDEPPAVEAASTTLMMPYGGVITAQAFSPGGRTLAVGMSDGTAALYDFRTKRWTFHTKRLQSSGIQAVALSPNGALLAACGEDNHVSIADARTGEIIHTLPLGSAVLCLAFSPDGKSLAAGCSEASGAPSSSEDKDGAPMVRIWSVPSFHMQRSLNVTGPVFAVSYSGDGARLLAAADKCVVFALPAGKKIWSHDNIGSRTAAISPDGKIVGGGNGIWNVDTGKMLADAFAQNNFSAFSRSGSVLICGSQEDGTSVYDGHTGKLLSDLRIFEDFCAPSPDGVLLAAGYGGREIAVCQIDEPKLRKLAYAREHPTKKQIVQKKLLEAVRNNDLAKVKSSLALGADPNEQDTQNSTLLGLAAWSGNAAIFQTLVDGGARFAVNEPRIVSEVLEGAIHSGQLPMLQWLLDHGVNVVHNELLPPVYLAAEAGDTKMIAFLLDHGAAIDAREFIHGATALMAAAENKKPAAIRLLLQRGADPKLMTLADPKDAAYIPVNALTVAVESDDPATVAALAGALPNLNDPAAFHEPLATRAIGPKSSPVLAVLLDKGCDPNARNTDGETPLITAARLGFKDCVAVLLAHHADVNAKDHDGKTALDLSTDSEITKMLTAAIPKPGEI